MVLYPDLFKNQQNKIMEGFELGFPQDADKFLDIFERFADDETFDQLTNELCEAFPDKREIILSVPVYFDKGDEN